MKIPLSPSSKYTENTLSWFSFNKTFSSAFAFIIITSFLFVEVAKSQILPTGFSQVLVAGGISNPTVMAFSPDGRIFVAQQTGQLRIIKNGALLGTPFISLSVNSSGERGLLGIAFDPNFASNNFIYLYYTLPSAANNRISRFTANGDVVVAGSEVVVLNLDPLSSATNHNGGTMQFGPDGKLYVGVGENANSANSQNLDTYLGKILRINSDGTVPSGNPFITGTNQKLRVWSYGLRNPYTITFQPGTGRLFVNDVGQNTWEEIDDATTGGNNYGWPNAEGTSTNPAYTNPVYSYMHGTGTGLGCAITGGTFFNPASTNYPSSYIGKYFYIDYCGNWIDVLTLSGSTGTRASFASSIAGSPVSIVTGNDGNLYFLSRGNSAVYKITYTASAAPVITTQPQSITVPQGNSATFSVTATGTAPLTYQWRKNGSNITSATNSSYTISSVTAADAGTYSVVVTNASGSATSNNATLTVTSPNQPPTATITTPAIGVTYAGGDVINFSGTATDPEDGTLGASAFTWYVIFHHDTHTHPGPSAPSGVTSGSFTIPNTGETAPTVFYRLYLVVKDSKGLTDTAYTDILPRTSTITLNTNPQGLTVTLDGQPFTAPLTVTSVEGVLRTIGATSPQTFNGSTYTFSSWSQGGAQTQTFATPVSDVTYTANFSTTITTTLNSVADAYVRAGNFSNNNYGSNVTLNTKTSSAANALYQTYIRFDISSLGTNSTSVKLRLYGHLNNSNNASADVQVFDVTSQTWQENTITYANKPVAQTTVLATATVTGTGSQYYEWDLTQHINSLRNSGATSVSLFIKNLTVTANDRVIYNSKESATNKPELKVTGNSLSSVAKLPQIVYPKLNVISFSAYPNPASNNFILKYSPEFQNRELKIIDVTGKLVKELLLTEGGVQTIRTDDIKRGLYFLYIEMNNKKYSQKILIEK